MKAKSDADAIRIAAEKVAAELLTSGGPDGGRALRLVLEMPGKKFPAAGWCEIAIVDRIEDAMRRLMKRTERR